MDNIQIKDFQIDIKDVSDDGMFTGYASVFNVKDQVGDVCEKGCFAKTLQDRVSKIKLLWQHDQKEIIGVWTAMYEDDYGLKVVGKLALSTQEGNRAYELMKMGALDTMSIGYKVVNEMYDRASDTRYLKEIKLYEVSLVTFPALEEAQVNYVKHINNAEFEQKLKFVEDLLLDLKSLHSAEPQVSHDDSDDKDSNVDVTDEHSTNEADNKADEPLDEEFKHSADQLIETLKSFNKGNNNE